MNLASVSSVWNSRPDKSCPSNRRLPIQRSEPRWDFTRQPALPHEQALKPGDVAKLAGQLAAEIVVVQQELLKIRELAQLPWDVARQVIGIQ